MSKHLHQQLTDLLKELHLPTFREYYVECGRRAVQEELRYEQYLLELVQRECETRRVNKIARLVKLPARELRRIRRRPRSAVTGDSHACRSLVFIFRRG